MVQVWRCGLDWANLFAAGNLTPSHFSNALLGGAGMFGFVRRYFANEAAGLKRLINRAGILLRARQPFQPGARFHAAEILRYSLDEYFAFGHALADTVLDQFLLNAGWKTDGDSHGSPKVFRLN